MLLDVTQVIVWSTFMRGTQQQREADLFEMLTKNVFFFYGNDFFSNNVDNVAS